MPKHCSPFEIVRMLTSATRTTVGTAYGSEFQMSEGFQSASGAVFTLDVTDADTNVGDKLDVYIQAKLDDNNWVDIVHFTTVLGNGLDDLTHVAKVGSGLAETTFEVGTALASGSVRNLLASTLRVKYVITDDGSHGQSFTFAVFGQILG